MRSDNRPYVALHVFEEILILLIYLEAHYPFRVVKIPYARVSSVLLYYFSSVAEILRSFVSLCFGVSCPLRVVQIACLSNAFEQVSFYYIRTLILLRQ